MSDVVVLAASALAVTLMVVVAALMGFRARAQLDEAALQRLAAEEGLAIVSAAVDAEGRAGIARLSGGQLMLARTLGDGVSARVAATARITAKGGRVSIALTDLGFPPLTLRFAGAPPPWLMELAR
jgi:hypothetical protein